jgi:cell division GTPase FtsZ
MEVFENFNPSGGFAGEKKDDYLKKVVGIGVGGVNSVNRMI